MEEEEDPEGVGRDVSGGDECVETMRLPEAAVAAAAAAVAAAETEAAEDADGACSCNVELRCRGVGCVTGAAGVHAMVK